MSTIDVRHAHALAKGDAKKLAEDMVRTESKVIEKLARLGA